MGRVVVIFQFIRMITGTHGLQPFSSLGVVANLKELNSL